MMGVSLGPGSHMKIASRGIKGGFELAAVGYRRGSESTKGK